MLKSKTLFDEEQVNKRKAWADHFTKYCSEQRITGNRPNFFLDCPAPLTVHSARGYATKSFIGHEQFEVIRAYVGKRGHLIFVFEPIPKHGEFQTMECPEDALHKTFPMMLKWLESLDIRAEDSEMERARKEAERLEAEAHARAVLETRLQDERFGSW